MTFADRYLMVEWSACEFQVSAFSLSLVDEKGRLGGCGIRVDVDNVEVLLTGVADEAVGGDERSISSVRIVGYPMEACPVTGSWLTTVNSVFEEVPLSPGLSFPFVFLLPFPKTFPKMSSMVN